MTRFLGIWTVLAALVYPGMAFAGAQQTMLYEVYAGGIHAVQARVVINTDQPGRYDITLDAQTRGLLGKVVPWKGIFESHGWMEKNSFIPELHKSATVNSDGDETKEYNYTKDGFVNLIVTEDGKPPKEREKKPELTEGTTDALSATLQVLDAVASGKDCNSTSDVFDGERRFKQVFTDMGKTELENSKYNIFRGSATECTVEIVPDGGRWHAKPRGWLSIQEQGRAKGTMPTIWLAQLDSNGPAVPVKIRVKTDYGTLFMHLAEYQSGDKHVSAEKRARP